MCGKKFVPEVFLFFISNLLTNNRYNIGHIGISLGDLGLAYQAFKVAVSIDPTHGEALNNIAVLEMRRQKFEVAKSCLATSCDVTSHIFEPFYNSGNAQ
jgi:tetratricopeptide repeat protein 8